jgi:lactobin A/cerein 7B family class IIb bacteriocin
VRNLRTEEVESVNGGGAPLVIAGIAAVAAAVEAGIKLYNALNPPPPPPPPRNDSPPPGRAPAPKPGPITTDAISDFGGESGGFMNLTVQPW